MKPERRDKDENMENWDKLGLTEAKVSFDKHRLSRVRPIKRPANYGWQSADASLKNKYVLGGKATFSVCESHFVIFSCLIVIIGESCLNNYKSLKM